MPTTSTLLSSDRLTKILNYQTYLSTENMLAAASGLHRKFFRACGCSLQFLNNDEEVSKKKLGIWSNKLKQVTYWLWRKEKACHQQGLSSASIKIKSLLLQKTNTTYLAAFSNCHYEIKK